MQQQLISPGQNDNFLHPRVQPNLKLYTKAKYLIQRAPSGINSETNVQRNGYMGSHVGPSVNNNDCCHTEMIK